MSISKWLVKSAVEKKGHFILIEGEIGIGKTRLVEELQNWVQEEPDLDFRFLTSRCLYYGTGDPYLPFIDALKGYYEDPLVHEEAGPNILAKVGDIEEEGQAGNECQKGFVPPSEQEVGTSIIDLEHLRDERDRMFENTTELIKKLSEERPIFLFLDDIHWADNPSLQLLQYLARNTKDSAVVMIAAYRPEELVDVDDKTHPLIEIMHRMKREKIFTKITPERLGRPDVAKMIGYIFGDEEVPGEFVERIFETTEGNPYFIEEVIRSFMEERILNIEDEDWREKIEEIQIKIPETIRDVIIRRIGHLDKDTLKILRYAALIGREFDYKVILKVSGMDEEKMLDCIDELIKARLIHEEEGDGNEERYKFDNTIISDVAYADLSRSRRRVIHRKVAEALEELYRDNVGLVIYDLARHFYKGNDYSKAVTYLMRAGETAETLYALEEAYRYYEIALETVDNLDGTLDNRKRKVAVYYRLGNIGQIIGKWQEALEFHEKMIALLTEMGNELAEMDGEPGGTGTCPEDMITTNWVEERRGEAYRAMAYVRKKRGKWEEAVDCYDHALHVSMEIEDHYGMAESHRGLGSVRWRKGQYDEAIDHYKRAIENIKKVKDPSIKGVVFIEFGNVYNSKGDWVKAVEYYERSIEALKNADNPREMARAYNNLGDIYIQRENWEKALEYFRKSESTSERIGNRYMMGWSSFNQAECYAHINELDKALSKNDTALELLTPLKDRIGLALVYRNYGTIYRFMRQWDESITCFTKSLEIFVKLDVPFEMGYAYNEVGLMYRDKGEPEKAREYVKKALDCFRKVGAEKRIEMIKEVWGEL